MSGVWKEKEELIVTIDREYKADGSTGKKNTRNGTAGDSAGTMRYQVMAEEEGRGTG